jgi:hypothetical protein
MRGGMRRPGLHSAGGVSRGLWSRCAPWGTLPSSASQRAEAGAARPEWCEDLRGESMKAIWVLPLPAAGVLLLSACAAGPSPGPPAVNPPPVIVAARPGPGPGPGPGPAAVNRPPLIVVARPGPGFPSSADYYPATSRRIGEQGATDVQVCVGVDGQLTAEPAIARTSGSSRLDEGALLLAKAAEGHYIPQTQDGRPVVSCFVFRVTFVLQHGAAATPDPANPSSDPQ